MRWCIKGGGRPGKGLASILIFSAMLLGMLWYLSSMLNMIVKVPETVAAPETAGIPERPPNERYAVMDKRILSTPPTKHPTEKSGLGYPRTVWHPDRYFLTFLTESERETFEMEVDKKTYQAAVPYTIVTAEQFDRIPFVDPPEKTVAMAEAPSTTRRPDLQKRLEELEGISAGEGDDAPTSFMEELQALRDLIEERNQLIEGE